MSGDAQAPPQDLALRLPLSGVHLVEASAGTGKTFALTAWILRLLLERGVPLPRLLAVTFTRAATAELRERIRRRLRGAERLLAGHAPRDAEQRQTAAILEQARAAAGGGDAAVRTRLAAALLQLDEAAVSTIHGFCQRALREFGFIAGSLGDEAVIDDPREAWDTVAADLWRHANLGSADDAQHLRALWSTPGALAASLPALCDPARALLPARDVSAIAAWLHALRDSARERFAAELARRGQRSQDQLLERMHAAMGDARFSAAVAARWPVALVDEFQDTDPRQWDIFRRLYEAGARRADAGGTPPLLGLVGDPKQAIYAFRGGDLATYQDARTYVRRHGAEASLDTNYRSRPAVLGAIETLFAQSAQPFRSDIALHPLHAARADEEDALTLDGAPPPGLTVHWLPAPTDATKSRRAKPDDEHDAVATTVAEIVRLLERGQLRDGDGVRPVRASDIAVLVRKNKQVAWMRDALAAAGIGAATQGNDSVFASEAAAEVHRLLEACAHPGDAARVRAALATRLLALDAAAIAALDADAATAGDALALPTWQARFESAGLAWRLRGPLPALLPFLDGQYLDPAVSAARLAQGGGTRLLTDALHLAELLQAQADASHGPQALLRWLAQRCAAPPQGDDLALRLDADADAVQVLTLHKAKGLEYPVVFLPFTAFGDGRTRKPDELPRSRVRIEDASASTQGLAANYFHRHAGSGKHKAMVLGDPAHHDAWIAQVEQQEAAEDLRLLYVGLTRARHALHVTWGHTRDSNGSALQWLLHAGEIAGRKQDTLQPADMRERIDRLARESGGRIVVRSMASPVVVPVLSPHARPAHADTPAARIATRRLPHAGGQYSFSGLRGHHRDALPARGADDEAAAADAAAGTALAGADFGNAVHDVLEAADFAAWDGATSAPADTHAAIARALAHHGLPDTPDAVSQVGGLVARALNAPLPGIDTLARLPAAQRVPELEFHFRLAPVRLPALYALLGAHGYPRIAAPARAGAIEGLMHGYIDLLYRDAAGACHVLDYKTNRLHDYAPPTCRQAVAANDYDLQYLIYLVAVQRWLRLRLGARYDPARHLGGAVYLFLRGIELRGSAPDGSAEQGGAATTARNPDAPGLHIDRPPQALIDGMDALFDGAAP